MPRKKVKLKRAKVSDKIRSHANDPFVIEKNRKAKAFLEKYGFPEEITSRKSRKEQK